MKILKEKYLKYIWASAFVMMLVLLAGCSHNGQQKASKTDSFIETLKEAELSQQQKVESKKNTEEGGVPTLEVHFLDVGQGDATLLVCDGHAMLIDAGENSRGMEVQDYLLDRGIEKLDYVVGTHPDADHIGGLDVILRKFDCSIVMFPEAESDTTAYRNMMDAVSYKGYSIVHPEVGEVYPLGSAEITVLTSKEQIHEESNDYSIGLKVTFGENVFLFIGDAQEAAQQEMLATGLELQADVLKAGHHGSSDSANAAFLEAVSPDYAVISCGVENDYGHPHEKTLRLFKEAGVKVFRTDEQGSVVAMSDGEEIFWNCEPSISWEPGVFPKVYKEQELGEVQYVLNTSSLKFHKPACESVYEMSKKNRQGSNLSREELLEQGYLPCNNCKP